ncbi:MAG TPA: serine/threonine-protein kinase [Vicinamibacterales bacterium]|nr:serine/threonine-protein kinase [Vicinamibacterales bacterium]
MAVLDAHRWRRASPHLDRVLDLPVLDREASLAALRAQDPEVAADVQALLEQHRELRGAGFLEDTAPVLPGVTALAGLTLGAYKLVAPIGQGGMGSVWLASRADGRFEGTAAVKLLNAELVGRTGGERFKREGTILARLTHPHIARLIDAGVSFAGQPYLVLEHVDGRHIDQYCDEHALGVDARIRLFLDVLSAVAHAHANLIVHRDLKPSNVLVTGDAQVKLLDFGIAKLLGEDADTHAANLTREAGAALTPMYAAPEQVSGGAITTATDVYSLGVLLYQLLAGRHPVGPTPLTPVDLMKSIVEIEPARVSDAASDSRRQRRLQGDLDTVVAKALKKNPEERYASVAEFADDLRRFMNNQPISARPDTLGYRASKFVRRHRRSLAVIAAAALVVTGVVAFYTVQLARERDRVALQAERASRMTELLTGLLTAADPYRTPDGTKEPTVQNLLDVGAQRVARDLAGQPELKAEMLTVIGRVYSRLGLHAKAQPLLEEALTLGRQTLGPEHVRVAQSLNDLGTLLRDQGNIAAAQPVLEECLAMRRRLLGSEHKDVAVTLVELARVLKDRGLFVPAEPLVRESLAIRRKVFGEEHRETATSKAELGLLLLERGDLDGAETLFRENLATTVNVLGPGHSNVAAARNSLALVVGAKGDQAAAERLVREAIAIQRQSVGENHPAYAHALYNLSIPVFEQGRVEEAHALVQEALRIARPILRPDHPRIANYLVSLARTQLARGEAEKAEAGLRQALQIRRRLYPATDWRIGQVQSLLGAAAAAQHRPGEAESLCRDAAVVLKPIPGPQGQEAQANQQRLAALTRVHH